MSKYEQQAIEMLKSMGASMELKRMGDAYPSWDEENSHPLYRFTIKTPRGNYSGNFYGYADESVGDHATVYDVLSCLTKNSPRTFNDFCAEYGYSNDSISALNTYREVLKEYEGMARIFTAEQLEKLQEIQ